MHLAAHLSSGYTQMDVANGTVMAGYGKEPVTAFNSTLGPTDSEVISLDRGHLFDAIWMWWHEKKKLLPGNLTATSVVRTTGHFRTDKWKCLVMRWIFTWILFILPLKGSCISWENLYFFCSCGEIVWAHLWRKAKRLIFGFKAEIW